MEKKRVGILTFHNADNLGAVLQSFALQHTLEKECKVTAEIIDYRCEKIESTKYVKKPASFTELIKAFPLRLYYAIKRKGFSKFRKERLKISENVFSKENVNTVGSYYDVVISGSDQVWNLDCSGGDYTFFLDFLPENVRKASYAASIGTYEFKTQESERVKKLLDTFEFLSVREKSGADRLNAMGISNVCVNSDPVMLLSADEWRKFMAGRIVREKYVLVYTVLPDEGVENQAKKYAEAHGCRVINNKKSVEFILHNSPSEFLSFIYYADCVFTNSFHGSAFSLIFNKPFGADVKLPDGGINNRISDLLYNVGAEVNTLNGGDCEFSPANAENFLCEMQKNAVKYLKEICN